MPIKIQLNNQQKENLLKLKRQHKSVLVRDRAQVILARDKGLTISNIAQALSRSDDFVKKAIIKFTNDELVSLNFKGNNHKLSSRQRAEIIKIIQEKSPNGLKDFKFKEPFWTTDILRLVIKRKYGIAYQTEKSYYDLFKAAGFSFHKPKTKDFRQDPAKMKEFKGALKKSSETTRIRLSW